MIVIVIQINTVILVIVLVQIARSMHAKKRRNTVTKRFNNEPQKKNDSDALYVLLLFCHYIIVIIIFSKIAKGMIVLLPLLGSTWIIGIFFVSENTTVFAWLFVIFNSLQVSNLQSVFVMLELF